MSLLLLHGLCYIEFTSLQTGLRKEEVPPMNHMCKCAELLTEKYFNQKPVSCVSLGGGFYGRVFLAELNQPPYKIAIKTYFFNDLNNKEAEQIKILSKHSLIKMPQIYFVHHSDDKIPVDALMMEYIDGINAGNVTHISPTGREKIANQIIDNLIGYHKVTHPDGFGEINGTEYEKDWRIYYRKKALLTYQKAMELHEKEEMNDSIFNIVRKACMNYEKIFSQPIETAHLIHGDYNTWNVLINREATETVAVIDPFNCCWADPELDLYQLNNANGKDFNLLAKYKEKVTVSGNFEIKMCFYELFTEIMHFYDAHVDMSNSNIPDQAKKLEMQMQLFGF
jgi:fructosamine-3-kinase